MRRIILLAGLMAMLPVMLFAGESVTLEECLAAARDNYPLIVRYGLNSRSLEISLSDINKSWLPGISVYGQGTVQNSVPSFPAVLTDVLQQMGQRMKGLDKMQYKIGVDVSQTVWDGGESKSAREVQRALSATSEAALDVEIYGIRSRVEDLYFGILLTEEQILRSRLTLKLLSSNLDKINAMVADGVAMQSDADQIEAKILTLGQQITSAESAAASYRSALELFTGIPMTGKTLEKPSGEMPAELTSNRPELRLFDLREQLSDTRRGAVRSSLMPRVGLFAQAYYGYPGFDYFASMRNRDLSFNVMAGMKVSWSIGSLYTRRNRLSSLSVDDSETETDREVFIFNSDLQIRSQLDIIEGQRKVMADDARIIALRRNVRIAAEAQLDNGIIDADALVEKITDEGLAALNAGYHEIELLKSIAGLKTILNR